MRPTRPCPRTLPPPSTLTPRGARQRGSGASDGRRPHQGSRSILFFFLLLSISLSFPLLACSRALFFRPLLRLPCARPEIDAARRRRSIWRLGCADSVSTRSGGGRHSSRFCFDRPPAQPPFFLPPFPFPKPPNHKKTQAALPPPPTRSRPRRPPRRLPARPRARAAAVARTPSASSAAAAVPPPPRRPRSPGSKRKRRRPCRPSPRSRARPRGPTASRRAC
jgi:hypothetical protein